MVKGEKWLTDNADALGIRLENVKPASVDLTLGDLHVGVPIVDGKVTLEPGKTALLSTAERVNMPKDCAGELRLRSSKARAGLMFAGGWVDPGFVGNLTCAVMATQKLELDIGSTFIQLIFHEVAEHGEEGYVGRYQDSVGAVAARG